MNRFNRVISTTILTCFIANTALSDLAFAQNLNFRSDKDKLAAVSRFDDMLGKIELQDMARIEMTLESQLAKAVGPEGKIDIERLKTNANQASDSIFKSPIQFERPLHNFINEVKTLKNGCYRIMCRVSSRNHFSNGRERTTRTYYAVFPAHVDDLGLFPIETFTESEWVRNGGENFITDSLRTTGDLPRRTSERPKDAEATRRYKDDGEKIDKFIKDRIAERNFAEIEKRAEELGWNDLYPGRTMPKSYWPKQLLDSINKDVSRILSAFGLGLEDAFKGKNLVFIKIPKGIKLPTVKFGDREIDVSCHTSNNAVYLFIEEEEYDFIENCVKENKPIPVDYEKKVGYLVSKMFHEAGVAYGLYPKELSGGGFLNDLDLAGLLFTSLGLRKEELVNRFPQLKNLAPVDLDILRGTNAAGEEYERDYAWGEDDLKKWQTRLGHGSQRQDRGRQKPVRKAQEKLTTSIGGHSVTYTVRKDIGADNYGRLKVVPFIVLEGPDQMLGKRGIRLLGNKKFKIDATAGDVVTMIFDERKIDVRFFIDPSSNKATLSEVSAVPQPVQSAPTAALRPEQIRCRTGVDVAGRLCWKIYIEGENLPIYISTVGTSAEAAERLNGGLGKYGFRFTDQSPEGSSQWRSGDTKIRGSYQGRDVDFDLTGPSTGEIERFIRSFLEPGISGAKIGPGAPKERMPSRPAPGKVFDPNPIDAMIQDTRDGLRDLTPWGPRLMPDSLRPKGLRTPSNIQYGISMIDSMLNSRQSRIRGIKERIAQERREVSDPKKAREMIKIFKKRIKAINKEVNHLKAQRQVLIVELESAIQPAHTGSGPLLKTNLRYYEGKNPPTEFGASGPQFNSISKPGAKPAESPFEPDSSWDSVETVSTFTSHNPVGPAQVSAQSGDIDNPYLREQYAAEGFITPEEATKKLSRLTILKDQEALERYYEHAETSGFSRQEFIDGLSGELKKVDEVLRKTRPIDELSALLSHGVEIKQLDVLRSLSELILQLLPKKKDADNLKRLKELREIFVKYPEVSKLFIKYFETRFDPDKRLNIRGKEAGLLRMKITDMLEKWKGDPADRGILEKAIILLISTVKTDYYVDERTELFLRIDPRAIVFPDRSGALVHTPPYAIIWVHTPYGSFGAHSRYTNIARGGLRCINPERVDAYNGILSECVRLSITQNAKHTDIPEGGSKGTFVYKQGLNGLAAAMGYIDGLINCALIDDRIAVASGALRVDPLELGPDESTDILANLITARAYMKKLNTRRILMTGKSVILGGIPHKNNNLLDPPERGNRVTSQGVMKHAGPMVRYAREKGIIRSSENEPLTLSVTGGFDGDVASGEMERSKNLWGDNAKIFSYVDKTGVVVDPSGIPGNAVSHAYNKGLSAQGFPRDMLSNEAFVAKALKGSADECYTILGPEQLQIMNTRALDPEVIKELGLEEKYKEKAGLKAGEPLITVLERDAKSNRPTKVRVHNMYLKDALFFVIKADILITGGGVQNSIDNNNWKLFFDWDGKPVCPVIVHGANIFIEEEASGYLEDAGVVIEPDEKANSVGVETSSRAEVDFNIIFNEDEGARELLTAYFERFLAKTLDNAVWKFWALRMDAEDNKGQSVVNVVSPAMSSEIIDLFEHIMNSDIIGDSRESYNKEVVERLRQYFPELGSLDHSYKETLARVFDRMSVERLRMIASKLIGKEAVLNLGIGAVRSLVKEFGVTEIDVIKVYLTEAKQLKVYENVKSVIDNKENLPPSGQIEALRQVRKYLKNAISARLSGPPQTVPEAKSSTALTETHAPIKGLGDQMDELTRQRNAAQASLEEIGEVTEATEAEIVSLARERNKELARVSEELERVQAEIANEQVAASEAKIRNVTPPKFPPQLPEGFSADIWEWWPGNEGYAMYMIADHNTRASLMAGGIWGITGPGRSVAPMQSNVVVPVAAEGILSQNAEAAASAKKKFDPENLKTAWSQFEYRLDQTRKVVRVEPRRIPSRPEEKLPGQSDRGEEYAFDLRLGAQADRSAMARLSELQGRLGAVIPGNLKLYLLPLESFHIALAGRYPELNLGPLSDDFIDETIANVRKYVDRTGLDKFTITISGLRRTKNDISIVLGLTENPLLGQLRGDILGVMKESGWKVEKREVRINEKDGKPNPGGHITIGKIIPSLEGSDVLMSENEVEKLDAKVSKIDEELRTAPISIDFDVISFSHPTREFLFAGWDREILIPLGKTGPAIPVDIPTLSGRLQTRVRHMTKLAGKVAKEIAPPVQNYTIFASYELLNDKEYDEDAKEYSDRFGLVRILTQKPEETVGWIFNEIKERDLKPDNVIAQLPIEFANERYKDYLDRLTSAGIKFMIIDTIKMKDETTDDRRVYRKDIYAKLLLARAINEETDIGSPLYRLLRFFIESHVDDFEGKAVLIDQYMEGMKKNQFINLVLSYKPIKRYDAVKEYKAVAITLMSA